MTIDQPERTVAIIGGGPAGLMAAEAISRNGVRVDMLKGNDYVRVWINRGGNNYLINLPAGA